MMVLQLIDDFRHADAATEALSALMEQDGYLGGRILLPSLGRLTWRVQAFFEDEPDTDGSPGDWFPDGLCRVFLPRSLMYLIETKET